MLKRLQGKPCPSLIHNFSQYTMMVQSDYAVLISGFKSEQMMGNVFKDERVLKKYGMEKSLQKLESTTKKENGTRFHSVRTVTDGLDPIEEEKVIDGHLGKIFTTQYIYYNKVDKIKKLVKKF